MSAFSGDYVGIWLQGLALPALAGLALIVAAGAVAGPLWMSLSSRARRALLVCAIAALVCGAAFVPTMHTDEAEHLHAAWLMSRGHLPYRDFWEHHSPMLWIALAPALRVLPPGVYIYDAVRLLSLAISAVPLLVGLWWVRRIGATAHDLRAVVGLWLAALVPGQLYILRPDLPANALVFGALWTYLQPSAWLSSLATGGLMGLAFSFSPKHVFFLALFPAVEYWRRRRLGSTALWLGPYVLGVLLGLAPLGGWLAAHGLLAAWWQQVFGVNTADKTLVFGGILPLLPTVLAGWWAWTRFRPGSKAPTLDEKLLLAALVVGLVMYYLQPGMGKYPHNLQMYLLLVMVAGALPATWALDRLAAAGRAGLAGALVAFYFLPAFTPVVTGLSGQLPTYARGRALLSTLIKVAGPGPVLAKGFEHPIFSEDAANLHMIWRWNHLSNPAVRVGLKHIVDELIAKRPTLLLAYPMGKKRGDLPTYLEHCHVISARDAARLRAFLKANYRLVRIGSLYWVRDDRPVPAWTAVGAGAASPSGRGAGT